MSIIGRHVRELFRGVCEVTGAEKIYPGIPGLFTAEYNCRELIKKPYD